MRFAASFGVTMLERTKTGTEAALALLGFRLVAEEGNRMRFSADGDALGNHLDVVVDPNVGRAAAPVPARYTTSRSVC